MKDKILRILLKNYTKIGYKEGIAKVIFDDKFEEIAEEIVKNCSIQSVSGSYSIDFGGHCKAKLLIENGEIKVEAAMNGWGDGISLSDIAIEKP